MCNISRGHFGEHPCGVILNLDQWLKRTFRLKKLLFGLFCEAEMFCAIVVEGNMGNIYVKLFFILTSDFRFSFFPFNLWWPFCNFIFFMYICILHSMKMCVLFRYYCQLNYTGKCIRRFAGIYADCRYFIDRKW